MFDSQESTPWYRSTIGLIVASFIVPPVGLVLLWLRRNTAIGIKLLGTAAIVVLTVGYFYGYNRWRNSSINEAHYAALERHRAQQEALAANAGAAQPGAPAAQPNASPGASPVAGQVASCPSALLKLPPRMRAETTGPISADPAATAVTKRWVCSRAGPSQGLTPIWKQPVGVGYGSFTVADGRAYTVEQRRRQEVAAAYDPATGRQLWAHAWNAEFTDSTGDGPRTTPTWDDGRIYALGATGELRCLDAASGTVIWGKNILSDNQASNLPWAMAASPLVVDDKVIVLPGGTSNNSVVAYNKMTGAPVWKSQSDRQAYVSPMLVTLAGRRQVLVVSSSRVFGLAPEDGSLLWSQAWDTDMGINVSQPIMVSSNRLFISSGYGKGAALMEVSGGGKSFNRAHDLGKHQHEEQIQQLGSS